MSQRDPNEARVARAALAHLRPYVADDPPAPIHLADNTNLFGAPPTALRVIAAAGADALAQYPTSSGPELREAIASYLGIEPNEVVIGCGGDDVIDCAFRALCDPGDRLAFPDPTFVMARYFAITNNLVPCLIPVRADGTADTDALLEAGASLTYICAPNNPTGLQPPVSDLRAVLDHAKGIVMIDEAYAEFAGETLAREVVTHGRAIIVRTFSKAFGLAGLRVGYAVGAPSLMQELEKARGPFAVSTIAMRAATAAITDDLAWVRARVVDAIAAREELVRVLRSHGFAPFPSAGNFLLVPVADARATAQRLAQRGISVRPFSRLTTIGDAIRMTVPPRDVMQRVVAALAESVG